MPNYFLPPSLLPLTCWFEPSLSLARIIALASCLPSFCSCFNTTPRKLLQIHNSSHGSAQIPQNKPPNPQCPSWPWMISLPFCLWLIVSPLPWSLISFRFLLKYQLFNKPFSDYLVKRSQHPILPHPTFPFLLQLLLPSYILYVLSVFCLSSPSRM